MDPHTAPGALAGGDAAPAELPAPRAGSRSSRKAVRPVPERDEAYRHLTLQALREYRGALQAEEGKVSYWRRILQGRLDAQQERGSAESDSSAVRPLLDDSRVTAGRNALLSVLPVDDIPPLPSLAELWDRCVPASDAAGQAALKRDLRDAEQQLSSYRAALHERLSGATGELLARYREDPTLCLTALPHGPARTASER